MLQPFQFYHVYNQGNNKQQIFFEPSNYEYFLKKVETLISPHVSILAYCLMPNHFHFLLHTNDASCKTKKVGSLELQALTNGFRSMESSYSQAINKKFGWSGSLFRQRTKAKFIPDDDTALICMNYIHQNPLKAGLVTHLEGWAYSSFRDYCGFRRGKLCDEALAEQLLPIRRETFYDDSYQQVSAEIIRKCF